MILSIERTLEIAASVGFRGDDLITIVAISRAESGGDTNARAHNPPDVNCPDGSLDRGVLQFNSCYHEDVSDACAYDPTCSFREGFRVVYNGRGFREWSSYVAGTHRAFTQQVASIAHAIGLIGQPPPVGVTTVSIDVPQTWVSEVSSKLGIADPTAQTPAPEPTPTRTYMVEDGDTLSGIAEKLTGDAGLWPQMYSLNSAIIGSDPNIIRPGENLEIPGNWKLLNG